MQPFKLRARGPAAWLLHCLRSANFATCRAAVIDGADHVLLRPCGHMHCHCCRWVLVVIVLQLCLWEGQLLMATVVYRVLRALLLLDAMLDHVLVPETVLPLLHLALPPICELRPRVLTLGSVAPHAAHAAAYHAAAHAAAADACNFKVSRAEQQRCRRQQQRRQQQWR